MDPNNTPPGLPQQHQHQPQQGYSGPPPPQQSYSGPPPPQQSYSGPPPAPRPSSGGLGSFIGANVDAAPAERTALMLLRVIAWISLVFIVIGLCGDFFDVILRAGQAGNDTFRFILTGFATMLRNFAVAAVPAAALLALASIVESLIVIRRNRM